jgi:hypothetical protein
VSESVESLVGAHLDAWSAPAGPDRDQLIAEVYALDVFLGEPARGAKGHAGVAESIAGLQAELPGMSITRSGPIQSAQDLYTYTWALGPAGRAPIASGRDVLIVREGKITSLYVLIDAP